MQNFGVFKVRSSTHNASGIQFPIKIHHDGVPSPVPFSRCQYLRSGCVRTLTIEPGDKVNQPGDADAYGGARLPERDLAFRWSNYTAGGCSRRRRRRHNDEHGHAESKSVGRPADFWVIRRGGAGGSTASDCLQLYAGVRELPCVHLNCGGGSEDRGAPHRIPFFQPTKYEYKANARAVPQPSAAAARMCLHWHSSGVTADDDNRSRDFIICPKP